MVVVISDVNKNLKINKSGNCLKYLCKILFHDILFGVCTCRVMYNFIKFKINIYFKCNITETIINKRKISFNVDTIRIRFESIDKLVWHTLYQLCFPISSSICFIKVPKLQNNILSFSTYHAIILYKVYVLKGVGPWYMDTGYVTTFLPILGSLLVIGCTSK